MEELFNGFDKLLDEIVEELRHAGLSASIPEETAGLEECAKTLIEILDMLNGKEQPSADKPEEQPARGERVRGFDKPVETPTDSAETEDNLREQEAFESCCDAARKIKKTAREAAKEMHIVRQFRDYLQNFANGEPGDAYLVRAPRLSKEEAQIAIGALERDIEDLNNAMAYWRT